VIALSTISHKTLLEDTLNQGFLGVLLKPFKKSELGEVLKTVLGS